MPESPLKHIVENDYEFQSSRSGYKSCWITVKNLSIYLIETQSGISIDVYALGRETENPLISTYAFFNEAEAIEDILESKEK